MFVTGKCSSFTVGYSAFYRWVLVLREHPRQAYEGLASSWGKKFAPKCRTAWPYWRIISHGMGRHLHGCKDRACHHLKWQPDRYKDEVLRPVGRPYAGAMWPDFVLMDGNAHQDWGQNSWRRRASQECIIQSCLFELKKLSFLFFLTSISTQSDTVQYPVHHHYDHCAGFLRYSNFFLQYSAFEEAFLVHCDLRWIIKVLNNQQFFDDPLSSWLCDKARHSSHVTVVTNNHVWAPLKVKSHYIYDRID